VSVVTARTNIVFLAGETLPIEVRVLNAQGEPITNIAVAKFALRKDSVVTLRDCNIAGSTVSVSLPQEETLLMQGDYDFEFRIKTGEAFVDSLIMGRLRINRGLIVNPI